MTTKAATTNTSESEDDFAYGAPMAGMVSGAFISRDGIAHYVPDWQHDNTAFLMGYAGVGSMLAEGFIYVAVAGLLVAEIIGRHPSKAQENALVDMYLVAAESNTMRCTAFVKGFRAYGAQQGWGE